MKKASKIGDAGADQRWVLGAREAEDRPRLGSCLYKLPGRGMDMEIRSGLVL
ncbi:MAG: hypothetical protein O6934_01515 [SAR324 cluster bacterium]|nr:hypothetical protein [SAR324 cluster bacterium]